MGTIEYHLKAVTMRERAGGEHDIVCYTIDVEGRGDDPAMCGICCRCELADVVTRTVTMFLSAKLGIDVVGVDPTLAQKIVDNLHPPTPEECDA